MAQVRSAVVAGSKGFVDAVQGHIKAHFGTAPRVASDPVEALRACADEGGLLVLEYAGIRWLEAVKSLRGTCGDAGLSIVAAVPLAQASDVQPLQRAGVDEVVSWQGRVDPVIWAVERIVDRQNAKQNDAQLSAPDSPSGEEIETGFEIREISSTDVHASEGVRPDAANPAPPTVPLPSRADARTTPTGSPEAWPDAVPSAAVAEALLLAMSVGRPLGDGGQLAAAEGVLSAASELERAAFAGADVPVEAAALRAAAAMRLRLDLALSTVPAGDDGANLPAAQQLVAEVDGTLDRIKALTAAAPPGVAAALEPLRLVLVESGIELAGVVSRLAPADVPRPASRAVPAKAAAARVLSNEHDVRVGRRWPLALWIALAVVVAIALAITAVYHGRVLTRPAQAPRASIPGAPANRAGMVRGGVAVFTTLPGKPIDAAELERFKAAEKAKGNVVKEIAPSCARVPPSGGPS